MHENMQCIYVCICMCLYLFVGWCMHCLYTCICFQALSSESTKKQKTSQLDAPRVQIWALTPLSTKRTATYQRVGDFRPGAAQVSDQSRTSCYSRKQGTDQKTNKQEKLRGIQEGQRSRWTGSFWTNLGHFDHQCYLVLQPLKRESPESTPIINI